MSRSDRLLRIEQMLARNVRGLRAVELAAACGVDRRTVYRDLALLSELGVPIYQKDGRFSIDRAAYRAPLRLSCDEALQLLLAATAVAKHAHVRSESLNAALRHLAHIVPEGIAVYAEYLSEVGRAERSSRLGHFNLLTKAWAENRGVRLRYLIRDRSKPECRTLLEMELLIYFIELMPHGAVYIVGKDNRVGKIRTLKMSRIVEVELLNTTYEIPPHFDPRPYLARLRENADTSSTQRQDAVASDQG
jgi:proteasome accessory factor B